MKNICANITFKEAKRIMDENKDYVILDVREEEEYTTGHAYDALLFPVDTINSKTAEEIIPAKDTIIMVYCRSGSRSKTAAEKLAELGYTRVYNIGGLVGWPYGLAYGL